MKLKNQSYPMNYINSPFPIRLDSKMKSKWMIKWRRRSTNYSINKWRYLTIKKIQWQSDMYNNNHSVHCPLNRTTIVYQVTVKSLMNEPQRAQPSRNLTLFLISSLSPSSAYHIHKCTDISRVFFFFFFFFRTHNYHLWQMNNTS